MTVNPTTLFSALLNSAPTSDNKVYEMIIYDWRVLNVERVYTPSIRLRLSDYE